MEVMSRRSEIAKKALLLKLLGTRIGPLNPVQTHSFHDFFASSESGGEPVPEHRFCAPGRSRDRPERPLRAVQPNK